VALLLFFFSGEGEGDASEGGYGEGEGDRFFSALDLGFDFASGLELLLVTLFGGSS
jgi:hypothetical protein